VVSEAGYGVRLERGAVVEMPLHPHSCSSASDLRAIASRLTADGRPLAADLFCGAGGLTLGLQDAGFEVVVGVDNDSDALATHAAVAPGLHLEWDLGLDERVDELSELLLDIDVSLIAGGPPCQPFSKAGRSLIRDLVRQGRRPPKDQRRDLWLSFLAVIERVRPPAVLMENVPDMALERDMMILRTMVDELERLGYGVEAKVVEAAKYGVPQYRQRLILVALADGGSFRWPHETWGDATAPLETSLWDAIGDLPDVEPGWRSGAAEPVAYEGPVTPFQHRARSKVNGADGQVVHDHITRSVRDDDLEAFAALTPEMKYSDLPDHLKRYRDDIFDDKYKRLPRYDLSRTITAHIAKDGYWYIHPEYHRTLTIREAARVQTFRDDVRFCGPPTSALRQIGNAVPPLLAEHLGRAVLESIQSERRRPWSTCEVSRTLAKWFRSQGELDVPWLEAPTRWAAIAGELILHRARQEEIVHAWPALETMPDPESTVEGAELLRRLGKRLSRADRIERLLDIAEALVADPGLAGSHAGLVQSGVPNAVADLACRVHPPVDEDVVIATAPVLRVAARFTGVRVDARNKRSDGRMAVARLIGVDSVDEGGDATGHLAHLALFELASRVCRPSTPDCPRCPLRTSCATALADDALQVTAAPA
jgi:DNA (cytosine-5)-methyltransferase 1